MQTVERYLFVNINVQNGLKNMHKIYKHSSNFSEPIFSQFHKHSRTCENPEKQLQICLTGMEMIYIII